VPQTAHTGMGVKISLGTYRMFFVDGELRFRALRILANDCSGGEDFYCRRASAEQEEADIARAREHQQESIQAMRTLADKHAVVDVTL
jgi:hypothetical protein